jgi:DNA-binding SARP family transcriptional activator
VVFVNDLVPGSSADVGDVGGARLTARLLGPLEVRLDGRAVHVRPPQERALLALLLITPSRVVSVAEIVSGLWGELSPPGAEKTVQSYVSRLRRALGRNSTGLLVTRAPGYVVLAEPDEVDAVRFARLADEGHRALAAGNAGRATAVLREASALWSGEALAEFEAPFAQRERVRLAELRLTVIEDRMSADLELGAGAELVSDLEDLVSEHPLRERLWEQLITG